MLRRIFVRIGHPSAAEPILPYTGMDIPEGLEAKSAKKLRKEVAENPAHFGFPREFGGFAPAELYWAVFEDVFAQKLVLASDNWYWRKHKEFNQDNVQPVEVMTPAGN